MRSRLKLKASIICLICAVLLTPATVYASGYQNISGTATNGTITWFYSPRTVTNPAAAGPEVAFYQYSESSYMRLFLGTHDCSQGGAGPMYEQYIGSWQPVHYYSSPTTFCLWSYSLDGSGSFNGDLAWD